MVLLLILVVLFLGLIGKNKWQEFQKFNANLSVVLSIIESSNDAKDRLVGQYIQMAGEFDTSLAELPKDKRNEILKELEKLIDDLEEKSETLRRDQQQKGSIADLMKGQLLQEVLKDAFVREIEIELLSQSLAFLSSLKLALESEDEVLSKIHLFENFKSEITPKKEEVVKKINELVRRYPRRHKIPFTDAHERYVGLNNQLDDIEEILKNVEDNLNQSRLQRDKLIPLEEFQVNNQAIEKIFQPLRKWVEQLKGRLQGNFFEKMRKPVIELLPPALMILVGLILTPILIKVLFYFVLAPLAALRPPLQLLPETSGDLILETGDPSVSSPVIVDAEHELLVHSDFLQSSSDRGNKDTSWFLNKKVPLTSLASGMVALTRIRSESPETFVISATKESLSEIGILSIPQGSALVMQPHNLVGIIQLRNSPVHITSHWRLNSLHAWLTLQLRYLAFHGPAKLIVQGCRGIRIEQADGGRSINQAATIGFSANVAYSTRRSETFFAYLLGKRELLNDNFSGEKGFYVYQEMPYFGKKGGFAKRGLEGLTDSLLKVFGI